MFDVKEYLKRIKTLLDSRKLPAAQQVVKNGLEQYSNQLDLLIYATNVFRDVGNY